MSASTRARRLAQGLCAACGQHPLRPQCQTCATCAAAARQYRTDHGDTIRATKRVYYARERDALAAQRWDRTIGARPPVEIACCGTWHDARQGCPTCGTRHLRLPEVDDAA